MKSFVNVNPKSLDEAVAVLDRARAQGKKAALAGGGSDLLGMLKDHLVQPDLVVNLKSISGLEGVHREGERVRIGALTTLDEIARHPLLVERYAALAQAAGLAASPQIRNVGTLGGNVNQRPWCHYFRQGFPCFKNGGKMCYAVAGENQFHALFGGGPAFIVHPSDTAPALVALEAEFKVMGPSGAKIIPAEKYFILPREDVLRENVLGENEILAEVILPAAPSGLRSTYLKIRDRQAWDHAIVSIGAALEWEGGRCRKARLVLGGVAPIPWRVPNAERLLEGKSLGEALARQVAEAALAGAQPLAKNGYKVPLAKATVRRAVLSLLPAA
ncbi:MAG: xanthine dehydrogenase family protein subunit M [Acidobacteria bacterium]|nr:xanthine dehydrogenase family protein subunit M [Acidobacteriota bacterium]